MARLKNYMVDYKVRRLGDVEPMSFMLKALNADDAKWKAYDILPKDDYTITKIKPLKK